MRRGFTLIEVLAIIGLIAIIGLLSLPLIINQVNNKREELSDLTIKMMGSAAELYMDKFATTYPRTPNQTYCITLKSLVDEGFLSEPIRDLKTNKEIKVLTKVSSPDGSVSYEAKTKIKVKVKNSVDLEYTFVGENDDDSDCR